ncbi:MAG: VCBS repeat-containing protein [candidate division Zixibacteria bacterium]|nr:VCBS repeat-containing protein [candidate division Zixibacteria bacterium]
MLLPVSSEELLLSDSLARYSCDVQYYYDDTASTVGILYTPDGNNSTHYAMRFSVESFKEVCTLKVSSIWMHGGYIVGNPDMRVYLWEDDGMGLPGNVLDSLDIPNAAMPTSGYQWVVADWAANGKEWIFPAGTEYHVGWTILPDATGDQLACVADRATGPHVGELRSSIKYQAIPHWYHMIDSPYNKDYALFIKNERCCTGVDCAVECPSGAVPEGEPTGCDFPDVTNAGCNGDPYQFTSIACGDTICGTAGTFIIDDSLYYRDTDWYEVTLADTQTVIWRVTAEFTVLVGLVKTDPIGSGDCGDNTGYLDPYAVASACSIGQMRVTLPPGTHWLFVAPASFYDPVPCDAAYLVSLECLSCYMDYDCDEVVNPLDNCPMTYNPNQDDDDDDGYGNACDEFTPRFEAAPRYGATPLTVDFVDESEGTETVSDWLWYFGDGQSSTATNPTHEYTSTGMFDVTLIIANAGGSDTALYENFVYVADDIEALSFTSSTAFTASEIRNMKTIDIDYDNNLDLVLCDMSATYVMISYGQGDGTFLTPEILLTGYDYFDFTFVNGDSLVDIVAANYNTIAVLLNEGDREFGTTTIPRSSYFQRAEVAAGYFDNDPYADVFVGMNEVYYGDGQGGFPIRIEVSTNVCDFAMSADVADFNADGYDDLVIGTGRDSAKIFLSTGGYGFVQSAAIVISDYAGDVTTGNALADFNRDGNCDFALVDPGKYLSLIYVGYGDGAGQLSAIDTLFIYGQTYTLAATDINRDLYLDIVAVNNWDHSVEIYLGDESGNFTGPIIVDVEGAFSSSAIMTSGDFDRDGNPDLAIGSVYGEYDVLILSNDLPDASIIPEEMATTGYDNVSLSIVNPDSFMLSRNYTTIAGSEYRRLDIDNNSALDAYSLDYNVQYGEYRLVITPNPNLPPDPVFSIGIRLNGSLQMVIFNDYAIPGMTKRGGETDGTDSIVFYYTVEPVSSIEPANGVPITVNPPIFDWSRAVDGLPADSFHFQLDRYYDFSSPTLMYDTSGLLNPEYALPSPLGVDSVFYWRYRSFVSGSWMDFSRTFAAYMTAAYICGDASGDDAINLLDILYLIDYVYGNPPGPAPTPIASGDVNNGDGSINLLDILYLIDYIYGSPQGPAPACE